MRTFRIIRGSPTSEVTPPSTAADLGWGCNHCENADGNNTGFKCFFLPPPPPHCCGYAQWVKSVQPISHIFIPLTATLSQNTLTLSCLNVPTDILFPACLQSWWEQSRTARYWFKGNLLELIRPEIKLNFHIIQNSRHMTRAHARTLKESTPSA